MKFQRCQFWSLSRTHIFTQTNECPQRHRIDRFQFSLQVNTLWLLCVGTTLERWIKWNIWIVHFRRLLRVTYIVDKEDTSIYLHGSVPDFNLIKNKAKKQNKYRTTENVPVPEKGLFCFWFVFVGFFLLYSFLNCYEQISPL